MLDVVKFKLLLLQVDLVCFANDFRYFDRNDFIVGSRKENILDWLSQLLKDCDEIPDFLDMNMESDDDLPSYKFAGDEDNENEDTESESGRDRPAKK